MVLFFAGLLLALVTILSPAVDLFDQMPSMIERVGQRFTELRGSLVWIDKLNEQLVQIAGAHRRPEGRACEPVFPRGSGDRYAERRTRSPADPS